jgi:hypothetical protein
MYRRRARQGAAARRVRAHGGALDGLDRSSRRLAEDEAIAHAIGGTLAGWALVEALRHRIRDWRLVALVALSEMILLTIVWELGEYAGDWLFDTGLNASKRDSAEDMLFGTVGGLVGITFASVVGIRRRSRLAAHGGYR